VKRSAEEAEVIVRLDYLTKVARITINQWPAMARKMRRRYGQPNRESGPMIERWEVPMAAISFRAAKPHAKAKKAA